jgi:hypothetical protein
MTLVRLITSAVLLGWIAVTAVGCSGINTSYGISPASFFLPGLMQNAPPEPSPFDVTTNVAPSTILAQAR